MPLSQAQTKVRKISGVIRRRDAIIVATGQHRHIGRRQILEGFTDNGLLIDAHIGLLT